MLFNTLGLFAQVKCRDSMLFATELFKGIWRVKALLIFLFKLKIVAEKLEKDRQSEEQYSHSGRQWAIKYIDFYE